MCFCAGQTAVQPAARKPWQPLAEGSPIPRSSEEDLDFSFGPASLAPRLAMVTARGRIDALALTAFSTSDDLSALLTSGLLLEVPQPGSVAFCVAPVKQEGHDAFGKALGCLRV